MKLADFQLERSADWERLQALLAQAGGRPERLGADGVRELGTGYRRAAADLALARRTFPAEPVTQRLETLVAAARQAVYAEAGPSRSPLAFLRGGYWAAVRALGPALALSVLLFVGATALTTVWGATDPDAVRGLVPSQFIDAADPPTGDRGLSAAESSAFSSQVLTNNIQVTLLTFAAGLLFGAGSGLLLIYNGVILGAVFGLAMDAGTFDDVVKLVVAHGVLELSCIVVAGAAGMRFGWTLVDPGLRRRRDALADMARPTLAVVLGTAPFLVVAGLMEGFVSPSGSSWPVVLAVGFGLGGAYWTGVALLGRRP